ncbi:mismatch-specific DNA-glycosylase, partial [Ascoidea rubescens DSM 1968]
KREKAEKQKNKSSKIEKKKTKTSKVKYYHHLKEVPDLLKNNLRCLFVGYNPSIKSSENCHRYAHPTNLFWRLLIQVEIFTPQFKGLSVSNGDMKEIIRRLNFENADLYLFNELDMGFTDLIARPTRNIEELDAAEMAHSVPVLLDKIKTHRPRVVCFVGKNIWLLVLKHLGSAKTTQAPKPSCSYGVQPRTLTTGLASVAGYEPEVHVFPSTSGLVTGVLRTAKEELFRGL